jgi:hypothetical protein
MISGRHESMYMILRSHALLMCDAHVPAYLVVASCSVAVNQSTVLPHDTKHAFELYAPVVKTIITLNQDMYHKTNFLMCM